MKKRILAVFAVLLFCLNLLVSILSAGAAETPHFLAVNENLLRLEDRYIPIIADGMYYVPYHALDVSSTGIDLGVYPVYNAAIRTLTIYNREKVIAFDLTSGTSTDRDGVVYSARAVTRNGQVYVPAKFICEYFGLKYTFFPETKFGPMIRICTSASRLNDDYFLAAAQMMMEDRLNDWRKSQTAATPAPSQSSRPTAARPSVSPTPVQPTPVQPAVDKSDVRTYLAFRADRSGGMDSLLSRLEQYQIQALFFFPADQLAQYDEEVRRVLCGGHVVGLLLSGATADELISDAAEGNRVLRQIAYCGTYTVLLPDEADPDVRADVQAGGLLIWKTDVSALPSGQNTSAWVNTVLNKVEEYDERVSILSDCSTSASALMTRLIPELVEDQYDLRLAVETEI